MKKYFLFLFFLSFILLPFNVFATSKDGLVDEGTVLSGNFTRYMNSSWKYIDTPDEIDDKIIIRSGEFTGKIHWNSTIPEDQRRIACYIKNAPIDYAKDTHSYIFVSNGNAAIYSMSSTVKQDNIDYSYPSRDVVLNGVAIPEDCLSGAAYACAGLKVFGTQKSALAYVNDGTINEADLLFSDKIGDDENEDDLINLPQDEFAPPKVLNGSLSTLQELVYYYDKDIISKSLFDFDITDINATPAEKLEVEVKGNFGMGDFQPMRPVIKSVLLKQFYEGDVTQNLDFNWTSFYNSAARSNISFRPFGYGTSVDDFGNAVAGGDTSVICVTDNTFPKMTEFFMRDNGSFLSHKWHYSLVTKSMSIRFRYVRGKYCTDWIVYTIDSKGNMSTDTVTSAKTTNKNDEDTTSQSSNINDTTITTVPDDNKPSNKKHVIDEVEDDESDGSVVKFFKKLCNGLIKILNVILEFFLNVINGVISFFNSLTDFSNIFNNSSGLFSVVKLFLTGLPDQIANMFLAACSIAIAALVLNVIRR